MTTREFRIRLILLAVTLAAALPLSVYAGSATPLTANIYNVTVDEQNTTALYNDGTAYCSGAPNDIGLQFSAFTGDYALHGPGSAYNFGSLWTSLSAVTLPDSTTLTNLDSSSYVDGTDCSSSNSCLRVQFNSNNKTLTIDTRGTAHPSPPGPARTLTVNLDPCTVADGCPGTGSTPSFGSTTTQPMLMNVFLNSPYINMAVCSSTTCPESQEVFAKLWFLDPNDSSVTWRVDWVSLRMLRMSSNTWYLVAGICDGTEVAGLSKLTGSRTRPKTIFNGYFKIPFFIALVR